MTGETEHALASLLTGIETFRERQPPASLALNSPEVSISTVLAALNSFSEIIRYLNTRRRTGAILSLNDEAAVQDVLYLMLRPLVLDLVPESPTSKIANRFSIKDFVSASGRFVIEAKFVRSADHGKSLAKEINDDIETYRYHPSCDDLIFFIYDPESLIPDSAALERHIKTTRSYDGMALRCHGVIKP